MTNHLTILPTWLKFSEIKIKACICEFEIAHQQMYLLFGHILSEDAVLSLPNRNLIGRTFLSSSEPFDWVPW